MPDPTGTDEPDDRHRLRWLTGFSPEFSDLWAHSGAVIHAPPEAVFEQLVTTGRWDRAFPGILHAHLPETGQDRLEPDSEFTFELAGLRTRARVSESVGGSRLVWSGYGIDIGIYQEWVLTAAPEGTHVLVGFAARGPAAIALRELDGGAVQDAIDRWITDLKEAAERS
ncbi:SRPBCC family protein [Streptomyces sp. NPDC001530]|uniref:SRPBCC family protein n=1 Tax=Streptomyces sp. NPDC001530 TaxID=3364582 RepID=UPI0036C09286